MRKKGSPAWNKKTHEQFLDELKEKGINHIPLEEYVDARTGIKFKCGECGNVWTVRPDNILSGKGCPRCRENRAKEALTLSDYELRKKIAEINPEIRIFQILESGTHGKSAVLCQKHNVIWIAHNSTLLRGCGCRLCANEKIRESKVRSHDDFVKIVAQVSPHIEIVGEYINARKKVKVRCKNHNETYYATADLLMKGMANCPKCTMTSGEYKVANYLDASGYEYIPQYSFDDADPVIKRKRFDFYLPELNTCIEYDGKQHFEPLQNFGGEETFEYTKKNDKIKDDYCAENNIRLIRIPYTVDDVGEYLGEMGL